MNWAKEKLHSLNHWSIRLVGFTMVVLIGIALLVFKDFGIAMDEEWQREIGFVNLKHSLETFGFATEGKPVFDGLPALHDYFSRLAGPVFELFLAIGEMALGLKSFQDVYFFRHLFTHLLFVAAAICFGLLFIKKGRSNWVIGFAIFVFYASPRIFAHSFYNTKDLVFLSLLTISVYLFKRLLKNRSFVSLIFFSLFLGAATNVRIVGGLLGVLATLAWITYDYQNGSKPRVLDIVLTALISVLFLVAVYPYLWADPLNNFLIVLESMSDYKLRWEGTTFFEGKWFVQGTLPWYYLPKMILITETPLLLIGCVIFCISQLITSRSKYNSTLEESILSWVIFFITAIPLAVLWLKESTVYTGWRHFHFAHLTLAYFAVLGWEGLLEKRMLWSINRVLRSIVGGLLLGFTAHSAYTMVAFHPHQYIYFNILAGTDVHERYEVDYWGISYSEGIRELVNNQDFQHLRPLKIHLGRNQLSPLILEKSVNSQYYLTNLDDCDLFMTDIKFLPDEEVGPGSVLKEDRVNNILLRTTYLGPNSRIER